MFLVKKEGFVWVDESHRESESEAGLDCMRRPRGERFDSASDDENAEAEIGIEAKDDPLTKAHDEVIAALIKNNSIIPRREFRKCKAE